MTDEQKIQEIENGVEKISKRTLSHFSKIYNIPNSDITNTTNIETEIYNLFIFDYAMHSHEMTSDFRKKYLFQTMDIIENKYGSELTNSTLKDLINKRFNQYAGLPVEGDDWPRKANELLIMNLLGSLKINTMQEHYPYVPVDFTEDLSNGLEFAQVHSADFKAIKKITNGIYGKKKKEGCYVATMVYEDYNADEVLVLRKFRDEKLSKTILGKLFIKFYYSTSPSFVRIFKQNKRVNLFVKKQLDRIVKRVKTKHN